MTSADQEQKRGDAHLVGLSDVFQAFPEFLLEANARLAASDDNGSLDDRGFHNGFPRFMQCANCTYEVVLAESYQTLHAIRTCT